MTDSSRPLAVVTGASSGIGLALARQFADHGFELVLAADGDGIYDVAAELNAEAVQVDLATPAGVHDLHAHLRHRNLTALALNAGITARSDDLSASSSRSISTSAPSCTSRRLLTGEMAARGRGRVLITASITDAFPGPHHAAYNASKAFAHSFAIGLRHELREHGVSVTVLEPGPTDTAIFDKADQEHTPFGASDDKDDPATSRARRSKR